MFVDYLYCVLFLNSGSHVTFRSSDRNTLPLGHEIIHGGSSLSMGLNSHCPEIGHGGSSSSSGLRRSVEGPPLKRGASDVSEADVICSVSVNKNHRRKSGRRLLLDHATVIKMDPISGNIEDSSGDSDH